MKITIKTIKALNFEIEVEPSSTVVDIKKLIGTTQGAECLPGYQQLLIYNGKILKDETTLEKNKILENDCIILMLCKSVSSAYTREGMETEEWGGIDQETDERCQHGKCPRCLLCWDGNNTGRRYLGCPLRSKSNMCDFIKWKDDKCSAMFLEMYEENEALMGEKEDWARQKEKLITEKEKLIMEKEILERELTRRTLLAQTNCSTLGDQE